MKRRTLFTMLAGALAATTAKLTGKPVAPKRGAIKMEDLLQKAETTEDICMEGKSGDELLYEATVALQPKIDKLLAGGATAITIHWLNILRSETNPDGKVGYFHLVGMKHRNPEVNCTREAPRIG